MARIPRIHIEGALYYATCRGDNNKEIFKEAADYSMYLELLRKYKNQYGFKLFAFCFMINHSHLLMELKTGITISDIMHDLNANYTKYFNAKHDIKGHLFQERYKLVLLEKQEYLSKASVYIHLNPVVLGLVKDAGEYSYSSYGNYVRQKTEDRRQKYIDIGEEVGGFYRLNPGIEYEGLLKSYSKQQMAQLGQDLRKKSILGSADFVKKVNSQMEVMGPKNQIQVTVRATNKKFVLAGSMIIILLSFFAVYFYGKTIWLKKDFANELEQRNTRMGQEYRQQMDSYYKQMIKNLRNEEQKVKYLQEKLAGEE